MRAAFSSKQAMQCSRVASDAEQTKANPWHETVRRPEADATPSRAGAGISHRW